MFKKLFGKSVFKGCECPDCTGVRKEYRRELAGTHECRFCGIDYYPEHCLDCGLAIDDPRRHRFLKRVDVAHESV